MKKSLFLLGLLTVILFVCKNNLRSAIQLQQPGIVQEPVSKTRGVAAAAANQKTEVKGFKSNIEKEALANTNFRKVLYTGKHIQLVLMSLKGGEEIGEEIHQNNDQFFRFESGNGKCIINGNEYTVTNGDAIIVPAGAKHNIINTDPAKELKMYTLYAPPQHKEGVVRATKKDAESNEAKFDGKTTE
jgi:mannose-6-phosphate isomerase-like protein (cupin superfamily)